jgi:hypothetical protein
MARRGEGRRNKLKQIFEDGWEEFKQKHPRYEEVDEVVQKMLGCGEFTSGYANYLCLDCLHEHRVAFSCKSTFCLSCAREYGRKWVETVKEMLHPGVIYRHLTLTMPSGLWTLVYQNRGELLEGLMKIVAPAMKEAVKKAKGKEVELGYIVVLQTAGRAATFNPHLHVLMTDGGLTKKGKWQELGYINYSLLHQIWKVYVLKMIEERLSEDEKAKKLVEEMRQKYPKGFVVHLQKNILPRLKQLTKYIVKYVVSPPMALSRIIRYEQEAGKVTYWYRDHISKKKKQETVSREIFIGRMAQHILPKGFQRIRYYGLQATCKLKRAREGIEVALKGVVQLGMRIVEGVKRMSYRERMKVSFGYDPIHTELSKMWVRDDIMADMASKLWDCV